jgi:hypothetical protein
VSATDTRRRMDAFTFAARGRNGICRAVTFYAVTRDEAAKLAVAWAQKAGYSIEGQSS